MSGGAGFVYAVKLLLSDGIGKTCTTKQTQEYQLFVLHNHLGEGSLQKDCCW